MQMGTRRHNVLLWIASFRGTRTKTTLPPCRVHTLHDELNPISPDKAQLVEVRRQLESASRPPPTRSSSGVGAPMDEDGGERGRGFVAAVSSSSSSSASSSFPRDVQVRWSIRIRRWMSSSLPPPPPALGRLFEELGIYLRCQSVLKRVALVRKASSRAVGKCVVFIFVWR